MENSEETIITKLCRESSSHEALARPADLTDSATAESVYRIRFFFFFLSSNKHGSTQEVFLRFAMSNNSCSPEKCTRAYVNTCRQELITFFELIPTTFETKDRVGEDEMCCNSHSNASIESSLERKSATTTVKHAIFYFFLFFFFFFFFWSKYCGISFDEATWKHSNRTHTRGTFVVKEKRANRVRSLAYGRWP